MMCYLIQVDLGRAVGIQLIGQILTSCIKVFGFHSQRSALPRASYPGTPQEASVTTQVMGFLLQFPGSYQASRWETWIVFLTPGFGVSQLQLLWTRCRMGQGRGALSAIFLCLGLSNKKERKTLETQKEYLGKFEDI